MTAIQVAVLTPQNLEFKRTVACTLSEAVEYEPEGIYTVARTYTGNRVLCLDVHLDRLEESARLENIPLQLDRDALRRGLRDVLEKAGYGESRFRITIPRTDPAQIHITMEPMNPIPDEIRRSGVKTATLNAKRENPTAKTTRWMGQRNEARAGISADVYEVILLNEANELLEGSGSNVYFVLDGILRTADLSQVLNGISRRVLLASVGDLLPINETAITLDDLPKITDAFLTSSSRGVVPIVAINDQMLADGQPGELTLALQQQYDQWTEDHLESL